MNTATSYDDRSRIRAQMRIVKKKTNGVSDLHTERVASDEPTAAPEPTPEAETESTPVERPISVTETDLEVKPVAVVPNASAQPEMDMCQRFSRQSSVTTVIQVTSLSSSVSSNQTVDDVQQSESVRKVSTSSRTVKRSLSRHLPEPEAVQPEMAHTLDITSSYGTGPMDENGRPLFGLGALRRRPKLNLDTESNISNGTQSMSQFILSRYHQNAS